jgi:hypothetical protein
MVELEDFGVHATEKKNSAPQVDHPRDADEIHDVEEDASAMKVKKEEEQPLRRNSTSTRSKTATFSLMMQRPCGNCYRRPSRRGRWGWTTTRSRATRSKGKR